MRKTIAIIALSASALLGSAGVANAVEVNPGPGEEIIINRVTPEPPHVDAPAPAPAPQVAQPDLNKIVTDFIKDVTDRIQKFVNDAIDRVQAFFAGLGK